jgi:multidrug efflux pump subunit AcrB
VTPYPGASALEVEEEVTDVIEEAAQRLGQLERLESRSERGLSTLTVRIQDQYDKTTLPQVWDELRRKVVDVQANLPRVPALRSWSTTSETSTASSSRSSVTSTITRS